jgi:hypothetical protein
LCGAPQGRGGRPVSCSRLPRSHLRASEAGPASMPMCTEGGGPARRATPQR